MALSAARAFSPVMSDEAGNADAGQINAIGAAGFVDDGLPRPALARKIRSPHDRERRRAGQGNRNQNEVRDRGIADQRLGSAQSRCIGCDFCRAYNIFEVPVPVVFEQRNRADRAAADLRQHVALLLLGPAGQQGLYE